MTLRTRIKSRVRQTFERVPPRRAAPHYLVYYDGSLGALAALREACEMAKPDTRITAVFLDQVPLEQALAENTPPRSMLGQAILAAAMVNARFYNAEIETLSLPCYSKGSALVALATKQDNTTLFVGVTNFAGHYDAFTEYLLTLAPCKVVLVSA